MKKKMSLGTGASFDFKNWSEDLTWGQEILVTISKPQVTLSNIDLSSGSQTSVGPNGLESSQRMQPPWLIYTD